MIFLKKKLKDFSTEVYRQYNLDLAGLSDKELQSHFEANQHERRIYKTVSSDVEFLSMKWLRGSGLEIGAGGNPTPLFGNAKVVYADCDENFSFGGSEAEYLKSLDDSNFSSGLSDRYDFVIASHVLEHCDSFLRALENIILITRSGGIVYLVLPNIEFLNDINFIEKFDFNHHKEEYVEPLKYADLHDSAYIEASAGEISQENPHAKISREYVAALKNRKIPQSMRFMSHKHNYDFQGWLELIMKSQGYLGGAEIVDIRYGHLRNDCHFLIKKTVQA